MDAFRLLERSAAVQSFDVVEHRIWRTGSYLRLRVLLRDGSELHTREFSGETERKYAFHWQTATANSSPAGTTPPTTRNCRHILTTSMWHLE